MTEHPYTLAQETVVISAFKNGVSVDVIAEVIGKSPASVEKLLKKIGLKTNARKAQGDDEGAAALAATESAVAADGWTIDHGGPQRFRSPTTVVSRR